ncbi:MAG: TetR/AcrR family transcriptional regulator [Burkholderiaceae bacterium]|nr:TetR/AcrR family transcriptional regulator [Burkholderiaceae bacterium]
MPALDAPVAAPARLPTEERQAAIVAALFRLAAERSPALITTAEIAAALGLTQGALFRHFPNKEAIWCAALDWVQAQLLQRLDAALASPAAQASPRAGLAAMFHAHVDFVAAHPGVPRLIFQELQQPGDSAARRQVRALLQAYRQRLLGTLARAEAAGELAPGLDQDAAATLFVGIVQGLVMQALISGQPAQMPAQAARLYPLFERALREAP